MAYVYPNYRTKKAFKEAVAKGEKMKFRQITSQSVVKITDGTTYLEGPHYPEPHRWYAAVTLKDGVVTKIK